jgi:hypothetical protein
MLIHLTLQLQVYASILEKNVVIHAAQWYKMYNDI